MAKSKGKVPTQKSKGSGAAGMPDSRPSKGDQDRVGG